MEEERYKYEMEKHKKRLYEYGLELGFGVNSRFLYAYMDCEVYMHACINHACISFLSLSAQKARRNEHTHPQPGFLTPFPTQKEFRAPWRNAGSERHKTSP